MVGTGVGVAGDAAVDVALAVVGDTLVDADVPPVAGVQAASRQASGTKNQDFFTPSAYRGASSAVPVSTTSRSRNRVGVSLSNPWASR